MNKKMDIYFCIFVLILFGLFIFSNNQETIKKREVAKVISAEACSEGKLGMWLVGNTILNRSKLWKKTPYEIVTQKNQYFGYTNPHKNQIYKDCENTANMITNKIYNDTLEDFTNNAIYYLRPNERVRKWHSVKILQYKQHTFYK